jgi:phosphoribosylaminoimidazolecarboxamide formyltransferase/IMP cyclohydrolase
MTIQEVSFVTIKRALISVSDKTGLIPFARQLSELGIEIISTGGTAALLKEAGIPVTGISEVTGFPEIMDGRVKTLHPAIHGGLLAVRDNQNHMQQMAEQQIKPIDLVVVNLYPFKQTISKPDVTLAEAIENIDIGGPSMLRSAAKNHAYVTVVVDSSDYETVLEELKANGNTTQQTRSRLAAKVFRHTAAYDALISQFLSEQAGDVMPENFTVTYEKVQDLRYGENPHQRAAFYREPLAGKGTIAGAEQLHGKELSYNNINDADAALAIVREFTVPAVVAVKHTNPCGVGIGTTIAEAYRKAYEADPVSIFGGIVAANRTIDKETALMLQEVFLEIILAPDFTEEALAILKEKKNLRLLRLDVEEKAVEEKQAKLRITPVAGGALVQEYDQRQLAPEDLRVVTERQPSGDELEQLLFAWKVVKHVKSNAIVLACNNMTIGVGAGQMNRVGAANIAIQQAGEKAKGAVLASDAFFPMADTVEAAAKAGITAIIQPGGSIRDQESIDACNRHGIAMVFTGVRHFKH